MNHISADLNGEVTSDGAGRGLQRVSGADHEPGGLDDPGSFPHHAHDGAGADVIDEVAEEGFVAEVFVVFLRDGLGGLEGLEALAHHAFLLEAGDDLTHLWLSG